MRSSSDGMPPLSCAQSIWYQQKSSYIVTKCRAQRPPLSVTVLRSRSIVMRLCSATSYGYSSHPVALPDGILQSCMHSVQYYGDVDDATIRYIIPLLAF